MQNQNSAPEGLFQGGGEADAIHQQPAPFDMAPVSC